MFLTNAQIQSLISCHKTVTDPPKREMKVVNGARRNDFALQSIDGAHAFEVFVRVNDRFPENFSIGLA